MLQKELISKQNLFKIIKYEKLNLSINERLIVNKNIICKSLNNL